MHLQGTTRFHYRLISSPRAWSRCYIWPTGQDFDPGGIFYIATKVFWSNCLGNLPLTAEEIDFISLMRAVVCFSLELILHFKTTNCAHALVKWTCHFLHDCLFPQVRLLYFSLFRCVHVCTGQLAMYQKQMVLAACVYWWEVPLFIWPFLFLMEKINILILHFTLILHIKGQNDAPAER